MTVGRTGTSTASALITGAAGFIGSHLGERCLELGWRVRALDAFTDYYPPDLKQSNIAAAADHDDYELVCGDLLDVDLDPLLGDVDVVFHLAAQPGVRASWEEFSLYTRRNVEATQRLLHAARGRSIKRIVLASSSSVYGDAASFPTDEAAPLRPVSPYGVTKMATESLAQTYWRSFGLPVVSLRYFTVYGPRQRPDMAFNRLIAATLAGRPFQVYGDGEQTRDFTFVADAVTATVAAGQNGPPGGVYNIGGGSRRSMNSVFETLEALVGSPVERELHPPQVGDARDTGADIARARKDLGFAPSFDFAEGLAAQLEWQRSATLKMEARA